jgi:predicted dehydrogenase
MFNKLRVGALGDSKILKRFIQSPEICDVASIEVIATRSSQAALAANKKYPNRLILDSYEAAIDSEDVDAIYICLPTGLHFIWAKKALIAGKNVLIEKPAVMLPEEAILLNELAKNNNLLVMEAWWYRFHPLVESLRSLIASNRLGAIRQISSSFSYINSEPNDSLWKSELGGGALYDMFSYHVDFLNYVMGIRNQNIELVQSFAHLRLDVDASISAELITDKGVVCNFMAGINRPSLSKTFIMGDKGSVEIPHIRVLPEFGNVEYFIYKNDETQKVIFTAADAYALMFNAFAQACIKKSPSPVPFSDTIINTELLARIKTARDEY